MPRSKTVKIGAWENGVFVGCVVFGRGATDQLFAQWGLEKTQGCELCRVALSSHESQTTKIVAQALRMLKRMQPGLRLVVSFANSAQGHVGTIYQAGNWIYTGFTITKEFMVLGRQWHMRKIHAKGWKQQEAWLKEHIDKEAKTLRTPPKYRYLMPLDKDMRAHIQKSAKPYPTASEVRDDRHQRHSDGGTPIQTLQFAHG